MNLTNLRLAAAIAYSAPDAEITLHCTSGANVLVARSSTAHFSPCQLRRGVTGLFPLVDACAAPRSRQNVSNWLRSVSFGGSLRELGGGVLGSQTPCGLEQRWLATTVPWNDVVESLETAEPPGLPADALTANVRPLMDLGVAVVALTATAEHHVAALDIFSASVAGGLMTEELMRACAPATRPIAPAPFDARDRDAGSR